MAGWTSNVCPHCGVTVDHGNHKGHENACLSKPETRAAILQALADPEEPTRAVSGRRYDARRTIFGAPYSKTLLGKLGTWAAVCAEFGLQPPLPYNVKCQVTPPEPCPYCGELVDYVNNVKHTNVCLHNPAVREAVRACLMDPQNPAHAISAERYNARRVMFNAPSDRTLVMQYDGTWEALYTDFGLLSPLRYSPRLDTCRCEHCGVEFATRVFGRHERLCPKNPAYYDALRAALQDADYPEYAVTREVYRERAAAADVASVDVLKETFAGWNNAVEFFGLIPADSAELQQRRAMMEVIAVAAREERILREDMERAGRLHGYRARDLPGVYVNGKPCVAVMLR